MPKLRELKEQVLSQAGVLTWVEFVHLSNKHWGFFLKIDEIGLDHEKNNSPNRVLGDDAWISSERSKVLFGECCDLPI